MTPLQARYIAARLVPWVAATLLIAIPTPAFGDIAILDDVVSQFERATGGWYARLYPIARNLFVVLATIELVVSGMWWALDRNGLPEIFAAFLRRMVALSFFYVVLLNADRWIPSVLASFQLAGATAGGVANISPSSLVGQGIDLARALFSESWRQGFAFNLQGVLVGAVSAILIFLAFVVIAAQYAVTLVELYIVIGGGVLLLGFSGSRWSIGFAEKYLGYAFATGVKLFVLLLIVGVGSTLAAGWRETIDGGGLEDVLAVVAAALLFMGVAWQAPSFASAMIGGAPVLTLGAVGAPAVAAGAALATGGQSLLLGAARAGVSAVMAGRAAIQYGRSAAAQAGGGRASVAMAGARVLASEASRQAGRRVVSGLGSGGLAQAIRERSAGDYGRPVPPPTASPRSRPRARRPRLGRIPSDQPPMTKGPDLRTDA